MLDFHPHFLVNEEWWDSPFFLSANPTKTSGVAPRSAKHVKTMFHKLARLLRIIHLMSQVKIVKLCNELEEAEIALDVVKINNAEVYDAIALWPMKQFNYNPRFIRRFPIQDGSQFAHSEIE